MRVYSKEGSLQVYLELAQASYFSGVKHSVKIVRY